MTSKFDKEQAIAFLKVIDPGATRFSFQTFDDSPGKRPDRVRPLHGTLDELWAGLCRLSLYGAGVFVTINETDLSGRKAGNIVRVRALFGCSSYECLERPSRPWLGHSHQRGAVSPVLAC